MSLDSIAGINSCNSDQWFLTLPIIVLAPWSVLTSSPTFGDITPPKNFFEHQPAVHRIINDSKCLSISLRELPTWASSVHPAFVKTVARKLLKRSTRTTAMRHDLDWSQVFVQVYHSMRPVFDHLSERRNSQDPSPRRGHKTTRQSRRRGRDTNQVYVRINHIIFVFKAY